MCVRARAQPTLGLHAPTEQCARLIDANASLQLGSSTLICVPVPSEHAANGADIERAIQQAIGEANAQQIVGRDITPYLLR